MDKKGIVLISIVSFLVLSVSICLLPIIDSRDITANADVITTSLSYPIDFGGSMPTNAARCAIVIDANTKSVLFEHNADEARGMASTTKIMTALIALENCNIEQEFTIPKEAVGIEGSSVYLKEGEKLTLSELIYCLMLESGNDAATAIAHCVGGSVDDFVQMMNDRAEELGLTNTHFTNPHGLSNENHKTTARELAIITAEAMQYPFFCEVISTKTMRVSYDGIENGRYLKNHNKLLFNYEGAVGVKTGYTKLDGRCLVSSATRDGMTVIAVTLQDPFPPSTHKTLLDKAFNDYYQAEIVNFGDITTEIPVTNAEEDTFLSVMNTENISLCLPKGETANIELIVPESIEAPIEKGDIIGKAICKYKENEVYIIYLEATETIAEKKKTIFDMIFGKR